MRSVMIRPMQKLLNIAIETGTYHPEYGTAECGAHRSEFMCIALKTVSNIGLITDAEYAYAVDEIQAYIREYTEDYYTLCMVLEDQGKPNNFEARLAIYKDWANRPRWERNNADAD